MPLPTREQVDNGVAVVTAEDNRWHRCDLKTTSLLGNVLMRQLAADARRVETVMFRDGLLTEASASNVLIVKDGTIVAPPKDNQILPGITYDATIEFAREPAMPLEVRPVSRDEALSADEMWLSSSTKEVLAVTTVDGKPFARRQAGPGVPQACGRRSRPESRTRRPPPQPGYDSRRRQRPGARAKRPWWNTSPRPRRARTVHDLADEHDVVARAMTARDGGTRTTRRTVDQRRVRPAEPIGDACEAVGVRAREAARELDLPGRRAR